MYVFLKVFGISFQLEVITLVPQFWQKFWPLYQGPLARAIVSGKLQCIASNLRDFGSGKHQKVDDKPYGGGAGMVLTAPVVDQAITRARARNPGPVLLFSPRGERLRQQHCSWLAEQAGMVLICPRFEGVDERVRQSIDLEISLGDFVVSTGDVAALVVAEAVIRLLPEVLGNMKSLAEESFSQSDMLEYPHYTRPRTYGGISVPKVLLSGNHQAIASWRRCMSLRQSLACLSTESCVNAAKANKDQE